MLERINGYPTSGRLGYFYGKNAIVSVAVSSEGDVAIGDTGAVASFTELKRHLQTKEVEVILNFINDKGILRIDGTKFEVATLEEDYTLAYSAQTNLKRIVDVIQQRAVILSTSEIASKVDVTDFINTANGYNDKAEVAQANVVSFLVERANVFDKDIVSFHGVPTGRIEVGRNLVDDLTNVPMKAKDGITEIPLLSASTGGQGNFAIKVFMKIPAQF